MPLSDNQIEAMKAVSDGFINLHGKKIPGAISYGVTSYGYDMRLGFKFRVFKPYPCTVIDPKNFDDRMLEYVDLTPKYCEFTRAKHSHLLVECKHCLAQTTSDNQKFKYECKGQFQPAKFLLIPPHSFVLAESMETFDVPRDCVGIVVGKSTYARGGLIVNCTPMEPEWCLAEDTEVLTPSGWQMLSTIQKEDSVLTRREDGLSEFRTVQAKQEHYYEGEMLHFEGRSVDQLVTPDHELFVHRRTRDKRVYVEKRPAKEVFGHHNYSFDRQVNWQGVEPDSLFIAGRYWDALDFLEFYGSWLGDGSAYKGTDGGYLVKLAVVTKDRKRDAFRDVLQRMGICNFRLYERGFQFYDKGLCEWLMQHGHAKDKFIGKEFLQMGTSHLEALLKGLMQSDGCATTKTYTTVSKQLADDVQEVIIKCGRGAIVREEITTINNTESLRYIVRDCSKQMTPKMNPKNHKKVHYQGMVYDITVPNHVFLSRRNGKVSWTGNCGVLTIELSNTTPLPLKIYTGEGIAQVLFFRNTESPCTISYADKQGKYQNQTGVTNPIVQYGEGS